MRQLLNETGDLPVAFEPYRGHRPRVLLDRHADGRLVALLVEDVMSGVELAGVWDLGSGRLTWAPDGAILLAWAEGGRQVLVLRRMYERDPDHPAVLVSPLQSEYTHTLERRSWPDLGLLGSCPIEFPTGWAIELSTSPAGGLATVTWLEQDCAGFVLVRWGPDGGDAQVDGLGPYGNGYYVQPNLIEGPVYSPDGRYAVAACSRWCWWAPDGDPETPSPGGRLTAGHVAVLDTVGMTFTEHEVVTDVLAGWLPPDRGSGPMELMGVPAFTGQQTFDIHLPTGTVVNFSLP